MVEIGASLGNILLHLRKMDRILADLPRSGTGSASSNLLALGLACPQGLIDLYGLVDGFDTPHDATIGEIAFFPGYYMLSIAEAVETYRAVSTSDGWDRSWFPVFGSGGGDFYAVICDNSSVDFGAVVGFLRGEPDQIVEFASVDTMVATISNAYSEGAFILINGQLKADFPAMRAIARRVQPGFVEHDA